MGLESNDELVDYLVRRGHIQTDRVEEAFRNVDRRNFVPEDSKDDSYKDYALKLAPDSTISAPHMIAENTELLEPEEDDRVIEIGSGSGYQVAILAELVSEEVIGVDIIEDVVEKSRERIDKEHVTIHHGNGFEPVEGKFDRILYSCAVNSFDEAREHLRNGGIAVAPVNEDGGQVLKKLENGTITEHGKVRFVPYK